MNATLVKWDASIVGEHPPLGEWLRNGNPVRVTTKEPKRLTKFLAGIFGYHWQLGVNAAGHPGCIEIIEMHEGRSPVTTYRRDA